MNGKYSPKLFTIELFLIIVALIFLVPFYFVLSNSFKSVGDILNNAAGLPVAFEFNNYIRAWNLLHFPKIVTNTLIITVSSNLFIVVMGSMAAYRITRYKDAITKILFAVFVASMVIPFQAIMIPLVKVMNWLGIINSLAGITICYVGLCIAMTVFLYNGFIKSVPREIEESAVVDGCTPYGVFWRIVFPLLKPMTVTVIMLNTLLFWNDFILPLLLLQNPDLRTIQLATNSLFGEYLKQWDLGLAALAMGITPAVIFFLVLQKYIIEGIAAGAVKG